MKKTKKMKMRTMKKRLMKIVMKEQKLMKMSQKVYLNIDYVYA